MTAVRRASLAVNLVVAVAVAAAWGRMLLDRDGSGAFTARGLRSLRFFTVLSNLLAGGASAAYAICLVRLLRGSAAVIPRGVALAKYAGAVSTALTLMTVLLFLGPRAKEGFFSMFRGANLWFHLIVPVLAALDLCCLNPDGPLSLADSLLACAPMALYALFYVGNLALNGLGKDGRGNDWYGFMAGGPAMGAAVAGAIALGAGGLALLMRLARS